MAAEEGPRAPAGARYGGRQVTSHARGGWRRGRGKASPQAREGDVIEHGPRRPQVGARIEPPALPQPRRGARFAPGGEGQDEYVEPAYVPSQPMSRAVVGARYVAAGAPTPRWTSLREWGIRPKLIIVLAIPTLAALSLGTAEMLTALNHTAAYSHVAELSNAGRRVSVLVMALQAERDLTADRVARGSTSLPAVDQQIALVDRDAADMRASLNAIDTSYDPVVQRDVRAALNALAGLPSLRAVTAVGSGPAALVIRAYSAIISAVLRINSNLWVGSDNAGFVQRVAAMEQVARAGEYASQQRALLNVALLSNGFRGNGLGELIGARAQQEATVAAFLAGATPEDQELYRRTVSGGEVDRATAVLTAALDARSTKGIGADAYQWYLVKSAEVDRINRVAFEQLAQIAAQARELRTLEQRGAVTSGVIILLILLFALAATVVVARSMIQPLRRLRSAAFEVADRELPDVVRRLHEGEVQDFDESVRPVEVAARDEIGQVARAFDEVHAQAVRLAGEQAAIRKNMSAMFVNLSRRSQSLVERQLRVIDELETSEQDPDQLASLFTLDLLATRMRRNDENLLVLAGAEGGRRWSTPVALLDVVRAAVAEVEQYARVRTDVEPGFEVVHTAVGSVVHLLAELLENAASFSAPGTSVEIRARTLGASGEVMIEVEDQGIGMTANQLAQANERLSTPPAFDVSASRMMGLYVVGRLAQRHDVKVRLRSSPSGGVLALVQLPAQLVGPVGGAAPPREAEPREGEPVQVEPEALAVNGSLPARAGSEVTTGAPEGMRGDAGAVNRPTARAQDVSTMPLPIFDTIQSEWFSRAPAEQPPAPSPGPAADRAEPAVARRGWSSPADEGWRAAQAVSTPASGGLTPAGLPVRVRGANLVPGSAAGNTTVSPPHPAHAARGLSSFQRGVVQGRGGDEPPDAAPGQSAVRDPAEPQQQEARQ